MTESNKKPANHTMRLQPSATGDRSCTGSQADFQFFGCAFQNFGMNVRRHLLFEAGESRQLFLSQGMGSIGLSAAHKLLQNVGAKRIMTDRA